MKLSGNDTLSGIASYKFEYRKKDGQADSWTKNGDVKTSNKGNEYYTYSGLDVGEYDLRVVVIDKAGNERVSDIVSGKEKIGPSRKL